MKRKAVHPLLLLLCLTCIFALSTFAIELSGNFIDCGENGVGILEEPAANFPTDVQQLYGNYFDDKKTKSLEHTIRLRIVRNLGKDLVNATSGMKVDKRRSWSMMLPAVTWCNGRWHVIVRLHDQKHSEWKDSSFVLTAAYDSAFRPVAEPRILGHTTFFNGVQYTGLEDARLMVVDGRLKMFGTAFLPTKKRKTLARIAMIDAVTSQTTILEVPGGKLNEREKNWTPFIKNGSLHILYSLHPVVELKCAMDGRCEVVYHELYCHTPPCKNALDKPSLGTAGGGSLLRGGCPMIPWGSDGHFFGFAHTTLREKDRRAFGLQDVKARASYRAHLFIYNSVAGQVVYISNPINFQRPLKNVVHADREDVIEYPSNFVLLPDGSVLLGLLHEDVSPFIIRLDGFVEVLNQVVGMDKSRSQDYAAFNASGRPNLLHHTQRLFKEYMDRQKPT
ncbi:hypothetical protein GPECTOR_12g536 [Gonium pectorale]|uniref:Uncharacterized protein n=1 Tax=Gonium pectorale TaxID=33097 RepID=A0A150GP09_GONPE|nr:hypothetical protein GPECTOR_12g536 [Gonium pectorale]|eukprot:KXZ51573.1 hypothetical protein GPECTOR_12g536 [Gonium pectorale]